MHEGAIAESIVDILKQTALDNNLKGIVKVNLRIGKLSGVMIDALLFALEALKTEEKIIESTMFEIERVDVVAKCNICNREFSFDDETEMALICPSCGMPLEIISGKEMEIVDIEGV